MKEIGVYKIENELNKKCYIGSTSTIGFEKRWKKHILDLDKNKHHSIYLQRAWNKYGGNNFSFIVLEECSKKECIKREQYYLDKIKPEYNLCSTAGSTLGYRYPKSYCNKLKKLRRGKNNPFYGKHHSEENRKRFSDNAKGKWSGEKNPKYGRGYLIKGKNNPFYGKKHNEETKKYISEINKGKLLSDKHPNFVGRFIFFHEKYGQEICGMCDLTRKYNLNGSHVHDICCGQRRSHHGWICLGKEE